MSIPAQGAVGAETMTIAAIIEERWTGLIGPAMEGGKIGWKRHELCREFANAVRTALTHPIAAGKLPLVALDFAEAAWGDVWVENEIDTLREFAALASPRTDSDERTAGASLEWAISRWRAEVENRPLRNVHRRSLDTTWRQVIRHFGGDPDALVGPSHDALVDASQNSHDAPAGDE